MAPEVFKCQDYSVPYGTKSDLFCLGVIAYLLMVGQNPLRGKGKCQIYDRTAVIKIDKIKLNSKWGEYGLDMIIGLLHENANRRWSIDKLLSCYFLTHDP